MMTKTKKLEESSVQYLPKKLAIYHSFEEQEAEQLLAMSRLTSVEILLQLRQMINLAYGMHGYDPDNLPSKHSIRIAGYQ
jgi:hypothetical protein